jgi:hypothetical protein
MNPAVSKYLADSLMADRHEVAERHRRARVRRPRPAYDAVTVRLACADDAAALSHLSQLERRPGLAEPVLVADVEGAVLAARSLANGAALADPFRPTAQLSELLALRAAYLRPMTGGGRLRQSLLRRLRGLANVAMRRWPR